MPPHRGHEYLAQFASSFVDKLWIFVCSLPQEPIPGVYRYQWIKALFPMAQVVHIDEANPAANRQQEGAQKIWAQTVLPHLPRKPDYIFASEEYGWGFAKELGATFIPVDPSRDQFPISGTELRVRPFRNWHFIPPLVRGYFVKEIGIQCDGEKRHVGEIIQKAALLLNTLYVPNYDDFYGNFAGSAAHALDTESRRRAQHALVISLKNQARFFLLRSWSGVIDEKSDKRDIPDLVVQVQLIAPGALEEQSANNATRAELSLVSATTVAVKASYETAPHAIRDLVLDRYKEWF
jgi:NadR type nicotinamide-nucleotide adenylyltransferase